MSKYQRASKYEIRQTLQPRIAPLTAAVSGALAAGSLQAATITVDALDDSLGTASQCTLRAALYAATTNDTFDGCAAGEAGEDTVIFDSSLSGTIALQAGTGLNYYDGSTLAVGESVVIDGDGDITLQGTGDAPVLYSKYDSGAGYNTQSLQLYGLTITGGGGDEGGGVLSRGHNLAITSTTITGNSATTAGGGVWHEPFQGYGDLSILTSEITNNSVIGVGGVGGGVGLRTEGETYVDIDGSTFAGNQSSDAHGGGLYIDTEDASYIGLKYNVFDANLAGGRGGGAHLNLGYAEVLMDDNQFLGNASNDSGGGLYLLEDEASYQRAEITFQYNVFENNDSGTYGGGAAIRVLEGYTGTIAAPVKFVEFADDNLFYENSAAQGGGGLYLYLFDTVASTIEGAEFSSNQTSGYGGGLLADLFDSEISIIDSELLSNSADNGGGVTARVYEGAFYASGLLVNANYASDDAGGLQVFANYADFGVEYSDFFVNSASNCGGGLQVRNTPNEAGIGHSIFFGNQAQCGGAIDVFAPTTQNNSLIEIKYNEISSNSASSNGGAVHVEGGAGKSLFLKNSTLSGNDSDDRGGGVFLQGDMNAEIKYMTIADNYAYNGGGAIYNELTECSIDNSILGGNTDQGGAYQDLSGTANCEVSDSLLAGAKYSEYDNGGGNIINVAPDLEPLADNGGNGGLTHALKSDSPAREAGNAGNDVPAYDQRGPGFPRQKGTALDMGAFEADPAGEVLFQDRFEQP